MSIDRARLTQPTRLALLEGFEQRTEAWRADVDDKVETLRDDVTVLKTRVGLYAALGAFAGGTVVSVVAALVAVFLH